MLYFFFVKLPQEDRKRSEQSSNLFASPPDPLPQEGGGNLIFQK